MERKEEDIREETEQERERRLERQRRRRQELRRRRRRKALILRGICAAAGLLLLFLAVWGIVSLVKRAAGSSDKTKDTGKNQEKEAESQQLEEVPVEKILHLSFRSLIGDTAAAFQQEDQQAAAAMDQNHLTVEEFQQILQQLYDQGYVLVNLHELAQWQEDTDTLKLSTLKLQKGKKPLIISQMNVNYDLSLTGQGCASRIVLDESGQLAAVLEKADGTVQTGAYDVIPCLEEFVKEHPDFSHNGAKGILACSGYNGILGYRTDDSLGTTENNRYASRYGVFDTVQETEEVKPVIQALIDAGWEFASCGYSGISYASDLDTVTEDTQLWKQKVEPLLGTTDILFFPEGTDIGTREEYQHNNEKYQYLKTQGFHYFCAMNPEESFTQVTGEYFRSSYRNLDGYRMYQDLYQNAGRFTGILDFTDLYDQNRPAVREYADTDSEGSQEQISG